MKRYALTGMLVLSLATGAGAETGAVRLTLLEAVQRAAEQNLDVRAELHNPAAAEADIYRAYGIYDPLLALSANVEQSRTPSASTFSAGSRARSVNADARVDQRLFTGGTVGASFDNSWQHNNSQTPGFLNDYKQSSLTVNFTQPLLKGFGRENTELSINVAKFAKEGSLEQFRSRLADTVTQVRNQYFQLYSLRENLKVRQTSLDLAEKILSDTQARVKAGVLPAMEILNAQFSVATQQKNVIDAERALRDQVDSLRVLLQLNGVTDIIPVDTPFSGEYVIDEGETIRRALAERPELKQLTSSLQTLELQSRVSRNLTLPQLDFVANAGFSGLAEEYNRDLEQIGSAKYPVWSVGLQMTYPIGNRLARNDYIRNKIRVGQAETQVMSLQQTITNEVTTAARAVRSSYLQLDVTARGRAYAEEVLQAYLKRQSVGLATAKDVQDVLNNLVTAQASQIQALADYNKAIGTLWRATGEILPREGISLDYKIADRLYDQYR